LSLSAALLRIARASSLLLVQQKVQRPGRPRRHTKIRFLTRPLISPRLFRSGALVTKVSHWHREVLVAEENAGNPKHHRKSLSGVASKVRARFSPAAVRRRRRSELQDDRQFPMIRRFEFLAAVFCQTWFQAGARPKFVP